MAKLKTFWYSVGDESERYSRECLDWDGLYGMAELAAESFNNMTAGEAEWPEVVILYETEDGPEIGRKTVHADWEISFMARDVEEKGDD